jgi:hypothetical protein
MRSALSLTLAALATAWAGPAPGQAASAAPAAKDGSNAAAAAACERAARSTVGTTRGAATDVSFNAPPVAVPGPADSAEIVLRGSGRARSSAGSRSFSYSCNFDTRSGEVSGVVVRDTASEGTATAPAARSVEPDLSNVSPVACESAAAAALKQRWPAVSRIAFSAGTRMLEQDSAGNAALRGQGTAQPAPNAPATHFSYTCAIDPRNGRVLATRIAS